jgi:hypothetical protein
MAPLGGSATVKQQMFKFKQLEPSCADSYNKDTLKGIITLAY